MSLKLRTFTENNLPVREDRDFVLYWMISNRRLEWNFSLQHAVEQANRLNKPLVILEALRCDYRWASDRMHTFIIQGMVDNQKDSQEKSVCYYPYIEPHKGHGKGLLQALSQRACLVVTDYFPCFFIPQMVRAALKVVDVRLDSVDSNGIYPLAHANRDFTTAASFRRHLQKSILPFIQDLPKPNPLAELKNRAVSLEDIQERWPATNPSQRLTDGLGTLPIDHSVPAVSKRGGRETAKRIAREFISSKIDRYHSDRNRLEKGAASGLSPYFHFGHLSVHELVSHIVKKENWSVKNVAPRPNGSREGWWGMSKGAEALMDELITWRELGYVFCHRHLDDYDKLSSLPEWAKKTIAEHKDDVRPVTYTLQELETAQTHDPVWNSAQRQLLREGIIHNYMRMLWGKKIYEWSKSAEEARKNLIELNNKYAIDGRNPNSYSGIFWIMGRFDRAWGPVRPVMGKLRYMSSDSTRRKLKTKAYEARYKPDAQIRLFEKLES